MKPIGLKGKKHSFSCGNKVLFSGSLVFDPDDLRNENLISAKALP